MPPWLRCLRRAWWRLRGTCRAFLNTLSGPRRPAGFLRVRGTLNKCVDDRSPSLKRMLDRWAKVHLKRMVVMVLRTMARGGARCTRGASLDCPRTGKVMLHACTEGTGHTDHTRTSATLTQGSSGILNSGCTPVCMQSGSKRNVDYNLPVSYTHLTLPTILLV